MKTNSNIFNSDMTMNQRVLTINQPVQCAALEDDKRTQSERSLARHRSLIRLVFYGTRTQSYSYFLVLNGTHGHLPLTVDHSDSY